MDAFPLSEEYVARGRRGQVSGMASATLGASPVAPSLSQTVLAELAQLTDIASGINGSLYETRQRLFGPWPQQAVSGAMSSQGEAINSFEAQTMDLLTRLRGILLDARDNAQAIGGRI
jgi:hypothetical protein